MSTLNRVSSWALRRGRETLLRAASPFVSRFFPAPPGYAEPVPPFWLRRHAGPPGAFFSAAEAATHHLDAWALVPPGSRVLDLGCGPGALVPALRARLAANGHYYGVDVHGPAVAWCARAWRADSRLEFHRLIEPGSPYSANSGSVSSRRLEDLAAPFDLVIAKSVFTHLLPEEARRLLRRLATLLRPPGGEPPGGDSAGSPPTNSLSTGSQISGGALYFSAFCADGRGLAGKPPSCFPFEIVSRNEHGAGRAWTRSRLLPHAAVAFDRAALHEWLDEAGLGVAHEDLGFFPGLAERLTGQDVFVARAIR